jgi:hypothetical protein
VKGREEAYDRPNARVEAEAPVVEASTNIATVAVPRNWAGVHAVPKILGLDEFSRLFWMG